MLRAACALLLLSLTACPDLTGLRGPRLSFHSGLAARDAALEARREGASAEGVPGAVVVRGRIGLPDTCYRGVDASLRTAGRDLTLQVVATRRSTTTGCADMVVPVDYRATISELVPGEYRVRVIHGAGGSRARQALSTPVRVP